MTIEALKIVREVVTLATMAVAMWQMLFTNSERTRENYENAARLYRLTEGVEAQQARVEAVLKIAEGTE